MARPVTLFTGQWADLTIDTICEKAKSFGFDGLEVEVAVRHNLPITWIVFNNNGIGGGPSELPEDGPIPPNMFVPNARYDRVIEAFGGKGYHVETPQELRDALKASFDSGDTTLGPV